jgi:ACT domain-containing protein
MNSREKSTHISTRTALSTASHTRALADTASSSERALNDAIHGADISRSHYEKFLGIVDKFYCWLASLVYGPG